MGTIIRALGHKLKPILIQFLKLHNDLGDKGFFMGEIYFLKDYIPIKQFGSGSFVMSKDSASDTDKLRAKDGFDYAKDVILSGNYDIVALDEIVDAVALDLVKLNDLIESP